MATKTVITDVCDLCGTEENVEPHEIKLDQKSPRVVDACPVCWQPVGDVLDNVMKAGRSKKIADRQVAAARGTRAAVSAPTSTAARTKKSTERPGRTAAKKTTGPKSAPEKKAAKKTAKTTSRVSRKAPA